MPASFPENGSGPGRYEGWQTCWDKRRCKQGSATRGAQDVISWNTVAVGVLLSVVWAGLPPAAGAKTPHEKATHAQAHDRHRLAEPHLGRRVAVAHPAHVQRGKASIYAASLRGRKMADGTPFNPASNAAASKTLPLGTAARVTNVENGRTTMVRVRDRGPHRAGRIIDVSPMSASALGIMRAGVAPVAVAPLRTAGTERTARQRRRGPDPAA